MPQPKGRVTKSHANGRFGQKEGSTPADFLACLKMLLDKGATRVRSLLEEHAYCMLRATHNFKRPSHSSWRKGADPTRAELAAPSALPTWADQAASASTAVRCSTAGRQSRPGGQFAFALGSAPFPGGVRRPL